VTCTVIAIGLVREKCLDSGATVQASALPAAQLIGQWGPERAEATQLAQPVYSLRRSYVVHDPPLLWKEVFHGTSVEQDWTLVKWLWVHPRRSLIVLLGAACACMPLYKAIHSTAPQVIVVLNVVIRMATVLLAGFGCLFLSFRAAGCVSREREQGTLEGLLILPVARREILKAKWLGSIARHGHIGTILIFAWALGLTTGLLHPWAVLLLVAGCGTVGAFLASIGVWLSLVSRNTMWANTTMALILLVLFGGSWLTATDSWSSEIQEVQQVGWLDSLVWVGLNPGVSWWYSGFTWTEITDAARKEDWVFFRRLTVIVTGQALFAAAAWGFWRLTILRFWRD
jgi:hypothetical protein